ncbi:MAG: alanine-synthesizing transaminase, partial [Hyphomonadaceae bacterium]
MREEFYKIKRLPPYVFEEVNKVKAKMRAQGADIIDFGMGNPDLPVPPHIIEKLVENARKPRTNRYSASKGISGLRKAMAGYYDRRFGVELNPETEVIATLGSKEGFANIAQAICAPGDVVIAPNPSYPIHAFGFIMAGGVIRHVEAHTPAQYLAGMIERAVRHSVPPPIAMILCYPGNPTAQVVDLDFYAEAVRIAKKHNLIIISDMAYSEIYFDDNKPTPSILQIEGAKDCTVEITTLSKTYSMAGFRVGFALGNPVVLAALARVKSYLDYGAYTPIQ